MHANVYQKGFSVFLWLMLFCVSNVASSNAQVIAYQKISDTEGGFTGVLDDGDLFGRVPCALGDLDGDGVTDLAVAALSDDDGGLDQGALWVLFLNKDGTVKAHQKISETEGGFTGTLDVEDQFGHYTTNLGDLDGDEVPDLAVSAVFDDDGGDRHGAVWILFMNTDGTVKAHQKISDTEGDFAGALDDIDGFGKSLVGLGDLDGDGIVDLAVGASYDDDGGVNRGAVWILFLNRDGTVKTHQKISDTMGGFTGDLDDVDVMGQSLENLGDLDGDGTIDLAVGASRDDDGGFDHGAVWILFLKPDGTVKAHQKISETVGGFTGDLDDSDFFAAAIRSPGDIDGDGTIDLAVAAPRDDDGGEDQGAVWMLYLNPDGTVKAHQKINAFVGGVTAELVQEKAWCCLERLGDLNEDGGIDFAATGLYDDDGGEDRGAVWILFTDYPTNHAPFAPQIISPQDGAQILVGGHENETPLEPSTPFTITWTEVTDPDGDTVTYSWQLAATAAFTPVLLSAETGITTQVETTLGTIAEVLDAAAVELGASIKAYHRAVASDGNKETMGTTAEVTLVRGTLTASEDDMEVPETYSLHQNYPNPFYRQTTIRFATRHAGPVRLQVYDVLGHLVETLVEETLSAGHYTATWKANQAPPGVYFYRLQTRRYSEVKKMMFLR